MYGNFKSTQDTWGRALAMVAAMGSKLGGGWMGGCAQKARMGWGPSQFIEAASKDENSSVRLGSMCLSCVLLCMHLNAFSLSCGIKGISTVSYCQVTPGLTGVSVCFCMSASSMKAAQENHASACHQLCIFCGSYALRVIPWTNNFSVPWFGLLYNGSIKSI